MQTSIAYPNRPPAMSEVSPSSNKTLSPMHESVRESLSAFAPRNGSLRHQASMNIYPAQGPTPSVPSPARRVLPVSGAPAPSQASVDGYAAAYSSQKKPLPAFGESGPSVQMQAPRDDGRGHKTSLPSFGVVSNQNAYITAHGVKNSSAAPAPAFPDERARERPGDVVKRKQEAELMARQAQAADPFLNWRDHRANAPPSYESVREPAVDPVKVREASIRQAAHATAAASQMPSSYVSHDSWTGPETLVPSAPGLHPRFRK